MGDMMGDTAVLLRGIPIRLYEYEAVSEAIRQSGDFYEAEILDFVREVYPAHRTIVDAGAFIGNHSVYFAAFLPHERIHAFEPIPANFGLLAVNVAPYREVIAHALALSDKARMLRMRAMDSNMGACRVTRRGPIEVPAVALDDLDVGTVTLLKIDVENHEKRLLAGARRTIARDHPLILIEDWTYGKGAKMLPGYELVKGWDERFTYLYRWAS
jgi:FkbM family methyltransferase